MTKGPLEPPKPFEKIEPRTERLQSFRLFLFAKIIKLGFSEHFVRTHVFVGDGALDVPKSATNHEAIYKPVKRAEQAPLYVEKAIRRK